MKNKSLIRITLIAALLLLIPLLARWPWTIGDFIFAGILILGAGFGYELISRKTNNKTYKIAVGIAVITTFLLLWINAAVGIIGDKNPANMLYLGVIIIEILGIFIAKLQPKGMTRALLITAFAQALVPIIALIIWSPKNYSWAPGILPVFVLNTFFVVLFLSSAFLFSQKVR
jgi:hypothetical protein